jgi:hypothetical protein
MPCLSEGAAMTDTPKLTDDPNAIYDALIAERPNMSALGIATARTLALALVEGASPATIASLNSMLPPAQTGGDVSKYNLRDLSDNELAQLGHLLERAAGRKSLPPREYESRDEMEMRGVAKVVRKASLAKRRLTQAEIETIKLTISNALVSVVDGPVWKLWMPEFSGSLGTAAAISPASTTPPAEAEDVAGAAAPNVVALTPTRPRAVHDNCGMLAGTGEAWRGFTR